MLIWRAITTRAIVVGLAFSTLACDRAVDLVELPGDYEFQENGLKQQIKFYADGTYVSTLLVRENVSWSIEDSWSHEKRGGKTGITFSKFRFGMKDTTDVRGFWFVVPEKTFRGKIRLCFDLDLNRCFQKF